MARVRVVSVAALEVMVEMAKARGAREAASEVVMEVVMELAGEELVRAATSEVASAVVVVMVRSTVAWTMVVG